jgi:hypothetical protein
MLIIENICTLQFSLILNNVEVNKMGWLIFRIEIFVDLKHQLTKHSCSLCPEKADKATFSS